MNHPSTNLQRHYQQADRVLLAVLWGMFIYSLVLGMYRNRGQELF